MGVATSVITLGAAGAFARHRGVEYAVESPRVDSVDSVGAGDAFVGAMTASLARGEPFEAALRFACAAGAIAVTRHGAIPSLPRLEEVSRLAARQS